MSVIIRPSGGRWAGVDYTGNSTQTLGSTLETAMVNGGFAKWAPGSAPAVIAPAALQVTDAGMATPVNPATNQPVSGGVDTRTLATLILPPGVASLAAAVPNTVAALRKSRGGRHAIGITMGDSISTGFTATAASSLANTIRRLLRGVGLTVNTANWLGDQGVGAGGITAFDPRITLTGGAVHIPVQIWGSSTFKLTATTDTITFACDQPVDTVIPLYLIDPAAGSFTLSIDGGTTALTTINSTGPTAMGKGAPVTLGAKPDYYKITAKFASGSPVYPCGMICYNSADPGVTILSGGIPGASSATMTTNNTAYNVINTANVLAADFVFMETLLTDVFNAIPLATVGSNFTNLISNYRRGGAADVLMFTGAVPTFTFNPNGTQANQEAYNAYMVGLAASLGIPFFDDRALIGYPNTGQSTYNDTNGHLSQLGYAIKGLGIGNQIVDLAL